MLPPAPEFKRPLAGRGEADPAPGSRLRRIEDWFCASLVLVLLIAGLLAVLRRFAGKLPLLGKFVLSGSLSWPDPLAQHLVLWVALFGAGAAGADRSHITIDALSYVLPERARRYVRVVTSLLTATVCAVFAWLSVGFVRAEFRNNPTDITFFGLHTCWLTLVLPAGFALLAARGLIQSGVDARALFRPPPAPSVENGRPPPA